MSAKPLALSVAAALFGFMSLFTLTRVGAFKLPDAPYDLQAILDHMNQTWNNEVKLWSTVVSNTVSTWGGGCSAKVKGSNLFWLSSENEINAIAAYELGYSSNAIAAIKKMLSLNPWHTDYRECILYGQLIPVLKDANHAGCQQWTGTLSNGEPYAIENNNATSIGGINMNELGANGSLAYQAINDWIRGGSNWKTYIDTIEKGWNGTGFNSPPYQTRALGAAGCAILICNYDPRNIFGAMQNVLAKIQWTDGSFPNSYTTLTKTKGGDAESYNRILLWSCPEWLAYMKSLYGTASASTPYATQYTPPKYIPA